MRPVWSRTSLRAGSSTRNLPRAQMSEFWVTEWRARGLRPVADAGSISNGARSLRQAESSNSTFRQSAGGSGDWNSGIRTGFLPGIIAGLNVPSGAITTGVRKAKWTRSILSLSSTARYPAPPGAVASDASAGLTTAAGTDTASASAG